MEITPYKGDPLKQLADAARRGGVRLGFYHSIMDWHHPDYRPRRQWEYPQSYKDGGNNRRYVDFMKAQLKELLTGYGDVATIWFDGEWEHALRDTHSDDEVLDFIHKLQPNTLINDRIYERKPGNRADYGTPEQYVPATGMLDPSGKPILWESCVTINTDSWGYNQYETQFKTRRDLIRMLIEVVSKGGNLLLNIGPRPDGVIQPEFVTRLAAMGDWLQRNGEAIYGTTASPFDRLPFFGRATQKGNQLFLHVFAWPGGGELRVPGLKNQVKAARLLGAPSAKLKVHRDGPDLLVTLPPDPVDDAASVVALELDGPVSLEPFVIRPDKHGAVTLGAESSEIETRFEQRAKKENALGHTFVTSWSRADDVPSWTFALPGAGKYQVDVSYGAKGNAGKELVVSIDDAKVTGKVQDTGGEWIWKKTSLGTIDVAAGQHTLRVKAAEKSGFPGLTLERVVLTPAR
jgi:alpha-L-fucosidase